MATCEELRQFFDTPLQDIKTPSIFDSLSSWNQLKNINNPIESSFTEIFGELHFHEKTETPLSPDLKKHPLDPPPGVPKNQQNFDSLQLCTEGLGFESLADVEEEDFMNDDNDSSEYLSGGCRLKESRPVTDYSRSLSGKAGKGSRSFPPPISTLGRSGKPLVYFKSYRDDGRFILREVRIPTHEFLHASRQDGRLKLQFVVHPNENNIVVNGGATRGGEEEEDDDDDEHEEMKII
ncbi:protein FAF-like, chloroplastic [Dioscorea cayenensis subsp. rotundata]|uniref:Protein FAF-like, chloroplastic n=1 Tax=Dioscorea cayennensis subsp. rotundata TaxID=55577 RepID=A0AB40CKA7_DIOCR|nr:protein FAF-like, chloroplastic [Dioscorea cayenensis subsp. rotundata]